MSIEDKLTTAGPRAGSPATIHAHEAEDESLRIQPSNPMCKAAMDIFVTHCGAACENPDDEKLLAGLRDEAVGSSDGVTFSSGPRAGSPLVLAPSLIEGFEESSGFFVTCCLSPQESKSGIEYLPSRPLTSIGATSSGIKYLPTWAHNAAIGVCDKALQDAAYSQIQGNSVHDCENAVGDAAMLLTGCEKLDGLQCSDAADATLLAPSPEMRLCSLTQGATAQLDLQELALWALRKMSQVDQLAADLADELSLAWALKDYGRHAQKESLGSLREVFVLPSGSSETVMTAGPYEEVDQGSKRHSSAQQRTESLQSLNHEAHTLIHSCHGMRGWRVCSSSSTERQRQQRWFDDTARWTLKQMELTDSVVEALQVKITLAWVCFAQDSHHLLQQSQQPQLPHYSNVCDILHL